MAEPIRFHLDEHCPTALADGLRRLGVDVTTTPQAKLLQSGDTEQLAFAKSQGRVLVTHDQDFLAIAAASTDHDGICYCHQNKYSVGRLIDEVYLVWAASTPEEMRGRVEYL